MFYALSQIYVVVKGQILKYNLAVWSHWYTISSHPLSLPHSRAHFLSQLCLTLTHPFVMVEHFLISLTQISPCHTTLKIHHIARSTSISLVQNLFSCRLIFLISWCSLMTPSHSVSAPCVVFLKWANRGLFLFIFVFSTCYNLNSNLNWWKHR